MQSLVPSIAILGVAVARLDPADALAQIERLHGEVSPATVFYANVHTLNLAVRDPAFRTVLNGASLVLNDGSGMALGARLQGSSFPANLNGTDFNPQILGLAARRRWPVYLLGAAPGVAEEAARRLADRIEGLQIVGTRAGFFEEAEVPGVLAGIRESGAELVMVAMGNPLQEEWLTRYLAATGARVGVGVGAFLDFAAERVARAPAWMNRLGVEWLYRLYQEPGRMWRRYLLGNPLFVARLVQDRIRRHRSLAN